ncbi:helix-turn-helix domain-containing protein [Lactobacillus terrae]|uniref:helix-turn-helix domain-containing protein n=1 Tax=Lactobacillus terrae TaxID=2269374 RepID=UPI000C1B696A|nr:helix-turn-helix transcriptional regulator [Lactobacillus terrae]
MTTFDRVKKIAKERGYTLQQLAEKAELGTNSIYHWKTKTPSTENLSKVADVLNVSIDYLLGKTDTKSKNKTVEITDDDVLMTFEGKEVSKEYREIIKRLLKED